MYENMHILFIFFNLSTRRNDHDLQDRINIELLQFGVVLESRWVLQTLDEQGPFSLRLIMLYVLIMLFLLPFICLKVDFPKDYSSHVSDSFF